MKYLLLIVAVAAQAAEVPTEFWGYRATEKNILNRLFLKESSVTFGPFLDHNFGLFSLLGVYEGSGSGRAFINGAPNSTNTLLWHLVLGQLASRLGDLCTPQGSMIDVKGTMTPLDTLLHPYFHGRLRALCAWPSAEAQSDENLFGFFEAIAAFDLPPEEYVAWRDFLKSTYSTSNGVDVVRDGVYALLMNPYFLLRH